MGALHAGHARLIEEAHRGGGALVVSIFVNPLQFDRPDDLDQYPRTLDADLEICRRLGVDIVLAPTAAEMYPIAPTSSIDVGVVGDHLCGRYRPGHFRGVATVVMKLLQIAQPDRAYFGEKDAQQLAIIRRLVSDFNVPVDIVGVPTVREPDGLALSSRNRRLNPVQRASAIALYMALSEACREIAAGASDAAGITSRAGAAVRGNPTTDVTLEYLEIVDPRDMQPVNRVSGPVVVAGALWVGDVRLIDNMRCEPPS
jgi:pantoate--beta-alanine ligase